MTKSKVYFADMRALPGDNIQRKLRRLMKAAGIESLDFTDKYVAIKVHFGEPGTLSYLRPNYAKTVVDTVKALGGRPFLTDCNTLYVGRRKNALDHLDAAYENGFSPFSTGCQILIADGLKGTAETLVPLNGQYVKEAKIGTAIMDADIVLSLNHFKGHELTGFGGALKNIGMGSGSRAGKMEQHSAGKAALDADLCIGCGQCRKNCAQNAITLVNRRAVIDPELCVGCGRCIGICPTDAIYSPFDEATDNLNRKMAEYALAVLQDRPHFHISLAIEISPYCDCHEENDLPIIPNIGMFASFDPVALDRACADAANAQPVVPGSLLEERQQIYADHFTNTHPVTDWRSCLEHAEKIGLGRQDYELIKVD